MVMLKLIRTLVPQTDLRASFRIEQVSEADESFARVGKQTSSIDISLALLKKMREGVVWIYKRCPYLMNLVDFELHEPLTDKEICNLITVNDMAGVVHHLDKTANNIAWNGNPANFVNGYRECMGISWQCAPSATILEYHSQINAFELLALRAEKTRLAWGCFTPHHFISSLHDLYILPLSIEAGDDGIYEQRIDYGNCKSENGDTFWTDDGEFLWRLHQDRWDFHMTCQTEFRIVVPRPELVTVIKDVPTVYLPYKE